MLKDNDFCDYDTCVALREIGCRIETDWYIHQPSYERGACHLCREIPGDTSVLDECDYIPRVSLYEAQKWFRKEQKLHITVFSSSQESWMYRITKPHQQLSDGLYAEDFTSYESALLNAIKEAAQFVVEAKL